MNTASAPSQNREPLAAIKAANLLSAKGQGAEAARRLAGLIDACREDAEARDHQGQALFHTGRFREAIEMVRGSGADDLGSLSCLAASLVALGDLNGAEQAFDQLIARHPRDGSAWYNRATVRRWTFATNHVEALTGALGMVDAAGEIPVRYGLAKELEDLGRYAESFEHLGRGAALRRSRLSYQVSMDTEAMAAIAETFDEPWLEAAPAARTDRPGPIFVLGLPRSGTTLVDRILSSHSQVASLGEIADFAMALMETTPRAFNRAAFIAAAAAADPAPLAARFSERLAGYERGAAFLIDKTPANFLYIGLIARALPQARIIHVSRDPMDVGYALYKTLFQTGCPYSYDLDDIGRYMGAAHRLMAHWNQALPGRVIEVAYEDLIEDIDGQARRLVAACGLAWEDACRDFHLNRAPSSTASAAQVRRPLYRDSIGLWRRYEAELAPLQASLRREGVL
jgi:tetratricopeptide (TPR) repeat protein